MTERTDDLVRSLARGLQPVRRLPPLGRVTAVVAALAAILIALQFVFGRATGVAIVKPDFGAIDLETICAHALLAASALAYAFGELVPGRERLARVGLFGLALAAAELVLIAVVRWLAWPGVLADRWLVQTVACGLGSLIPAAIPALLLTAFAARAVPRHALRALVAAGAASVALLTLPGILRCEFPDQMHHVVGHLLAPVIGAVVLLAFALPVYVSVRARRNH